MNHRRVRGSYAIDLSSQWNGFTQAAQDLFTSLIKPFPSTCLNKILPNSLFGQRSQLMPLVMFSICTSHLGCFVFLCTVQWNSSWWATVSRMKPPPCLSLKLRDGKTLKSHWDWWAICSTASFLNVTFTSHRARLQWVDTHLPAFALAPISTGLFRLTAGLQGETQDLYSLCVPAEYWIYIPCLHHSHLLPHSCPVPHPPIPPRARILS